MNSIDLNQFFRFFGPGGATILTYIYLLWSENASFVALGIPKDANLTAIGVIVAILAAAVGYFISTIYHAVMNLGDKCGLGIDHRKILDQLSKRNDTLRKILLKDVVGTKVEACALSRWGSSSLLDGAFYRLYSDTKGNKSEGEMYRFERYFHILHGVGAMIVGIFSALLFWLIRAKSHDYVYNGPCALRLLPIIFVLILIVVNWISLRRIARSYVESWFVDMLDKSCADITLIVRSGQLAKCCCCPCC